MAGGRAMNPRFEHRTLQAPAPADASVRLARLSPSGRRVAFARDDYVMSGIWVGDVGDSLGARRVVALSPHRVESLAFSPDGAHVAYRVGPLLGGNPTIGWASLAEGGGEVRRVLGASCAWTPGGKALIVADPRRRGVFRQALDGDVERVLGELYDDMDPGFPSRIAVSPDGQRIVYTAGRIADGVSEVWVATRDGDTGAVTTELVTEVPGANVHILPFWSPKGASLGLFCVHEEQDKSAIIVLPKLEGEGEVLYESSLVDPPIVPAWTPSGRYIAFFRREKPGDEQGEGPSRLVLLDVRRETFLSLSEPDEVSGTPSFQDERTLAVDGGRAAHLFIFDEAP
jgi:Tol biopolymer transport system component